MSSENLEYNNTCANPLALCDTSDKEQFWLDDPTELYKDGKYTKFIPMYKMTRNQQLNTIARFSLYMIIIILFFNRGETLLILPITLLLLTVLFKKFKILDSESGEKEIDRILDIRQEDKDRLEELKKREYVYDGEKKYKTYEEMSEEEEKRKGYKLEAGIYDSDNELHIGPKEKPSNKLKIDEPSLYTIDEMMDYEKNTCRRPTNDNPMMNPHALEFGNGDPPAACNANDEDIKDNMKVTFNHDLFRDVDELWERENSQRQFYTMPNTAIPNNQTEFAKFLYHTKNRNCKTDSQCLRYDDLRFRIR